MSDQRSDLAKARDAWLVTDVAERCKAGAPRSEYLENRLVEAFKAGWDAALRERRHG